MRTVEVSAMLYQLRDSLENQVEALSIKGEGLAKFILVEHNGRSCEVSIDNDKFWIEFWAESDDEYASPIKEATSQTVVEALKLIKEWLRVPL